jgi:GT2 family glycosyltransferase
MADDLPPILPLPAGELDSARRRITQLETALMRRSELLEEKQAELEGIKKSAAWHLAWLMYRVQDRLMPMHTRRRRWFRTCVRTTMRGAKSVYHRLTGRDGESLIGKETLGAPEVALDLIQYARWIQKHEPTAQALRWQRATNFARKPTISIVMPTYNTPAAFLTDVIESVLAQTYVHWELCIADGNSSADWVRPMLEQYAAKDSRIKVQFLDANRGISGNTNAALALAGGEFVALLDHDDTLAPFALFEVVQALNHQPEADLIYSDEDKLDETGRRVDPCFKPDWSPDTLRSYNYICHLLVLRRTLIESLGGVREGFDGAQDYDLVLRASEQARRIVHVPKVLYHWRMHRQSTAFDTKSKTYIVEAGCKALTEHLERMRTPARVLPTSLAGAYRVIYHLPNQPLVSILIPNHDSAAMLARCVESLGRTSYANYELVILENNSKLSETFDYYRQIERQGNVRIVTWNKPFNYASVNNFGATKAAGDVLLFLNNDVEVINPDWLEWMVKHALRPEVGVVGAKLLYADDTIQHAGIVVGMGGVAGHVHLRFPRDAEGYMQRLRVTHNCAAVTGACLMSRRDVFEKAGGFDESFVLAFNDVDLCLQIQALGYRVIWTPEAELYHLESKTRGYEDTPEKQARFSREYKLFVTKWGQYLKTGDPYYNPNFRLDRSDYALRA